MSATTETAITVPAPMTLPEAAHAAAQFELSLSLRFASLPGQTRATTEENLVHHGVIGPAVRLSVLA